MLRERERFKEKKCTRNETLGDTKFEVLLRENEIAKEMEVK